MNREKLKERLNSFREQSSKSTTKVIWKPQPGSQVIRLLPYIHDKEWPFLELYFYYDLAQRTIISPRVFGEPDPVHELVEKLKATGEREDWLLSRKIDAKMRVYIPILERGKENEGVKFWGFGKTVYEELLKTIEDPDYGDITDLKNGSDITVEYEKPKDGYPKTTFRVKRNSSPATTDKEVVALIQQMPTIRDIWEPPTYEELSDVLDKFINNEEDTQQDDSTDVDSADVFGDFGTVTASSAKDDIDSAFESLF